VQRKSRQRLGVAGVVRGDLRNIITVSLDQLTRIIVSTKYHRLFLPTRVKCDELAIKRDCSQCLRNARQRITRRVCRNITALLILYFSFLA